MTGGRADARQKVRRAEDTHNARMRETGKDGRAYIGEERKRAKAWKRALIIYAGNMAIESAATAFALAAANEKLQRGRFVRGYILPSVARAVRAGRLKS